MSSSIGVNIVIAIRNFLENGILDFEYHFLDFLTYQLPPVSFVTLILHRLILLPSVARLSIPRILPNVIRLSYFSMLLYLQSTNRIRLQLKNNWRIYSSPLNRWQRADFLKKEIFYFTTNSIWRVSWVVRDVCSFFVWFSNKYITSAIRIMCFRVSISPIIIFIFA